MKDLAIVILNYNGRAYLEKFLPDVISYSDDARIIVADNASDDDSVRFLKQNHPSVEIIELPVNLGYSGGYDTVLRKIDADYFCLLNSDVRVTENWLKAVLDLFEKDNNIAAVQPKILSFNEPDTFEYAGAAGGYIDKYGFPFCRGRLFWSFEKDTGQYDDNCEVFWASGACLFIRSKAFMEAGGLDEDFFAHMEEIDLCWRLWGMGYKVMYTGSSLVYHVGGGTLDKENPKKTYLNFRNGLSMVYKNVTAQTLFNRMAMRVLFDLLAFVRFILIFQWNHALAVLRAHAHFFGRLKAQSEKRKNVQALMRISDIPVIYKESLVLEYFLKGKREFTKLKNFSLKRTQ